VTNRFLEYVCDALSDVCKAYGLTLVELSSNEILCVGSGYVLMFWSEPDGLSMHYLDVDNRSAPCSINLGTHLASKRQWVVDERISPSADMETKIQVGLKNCAITLSKVAPDILSGDKRWLKGEAPVCDPLRIDQFERVLRCADAIDH
jgi:hypothetical protein